MSDTMTPAGVVQKPRRTLTRAVIRFAGDSGDGMQVTGEQFTTEAAWAGNDISTLPNFPAEIRAPAGTLFGVSSFQLQFGSQRVYTPGDQLDALVAMNPAALKVHLADLKPGGILIVNTAAFDKRNLDKAGYAKNPLEDAALGEKYRLYQVDISGMTMKGLEDLPLNAKEKERCKNFFALGLVSWIYTRPLDPTLDAIKKRFAKNQTYVEANIRVLKAGHAFGETAEMFAEHYGVEPAEMAPGTYRSMTGNRALAWGLLAAAQRTQIPIVFGAYPITPASSILEELALHKSFRVRTFQAEDEIAAATSAIGASFGGALGVTASSGPGIALKGEAIGLAVTAELPLVIFDIQRGGPSTGLPTKTEQADLMQALYGRNSESPIVVIAPCDAGRLLLHRLRGGADRDQVHGPGDGALRRVSRQWVGAVAHSRRHDAARHPRQLPHRPGGLLPVSPRSRDAGAPVGASGHARPRASDRRHREAGRDGQYLVRAGQSRAHGADARGEGAPGGPGNPAHEHQRARRRATCWWSAGAARTGRSRRRSRKRRSRARAWRRCTCAISIRCRPTSARSSASTGGSWCRRSIAGSSSASCARSTWSTRWGTTA